MTNLSFEFIANACGIFTGKNGTRILCDPWIVNGVFEGSWCHYPPLKTTLNNLKNVDAIYLSHIHPDHFDERNFIFNKSIPIIVLNQGPNFLIKKLTSLGFENLICVKDGETQRFNEFDITLYAPFAKHNFHESDIGNLVDSALLISCDGVSAFNANDNTPTVDSLRGLVKKFGLIDLAMINYNAAGPYPSCFDNLTIKEKKSEHRRIIKRNFKYLLGLLIEMKPKYFLPFAGSYVLCGREHYKNDFLGTTSWDECAEWIKPKIKSSRVVTLRENDIFDIASGVSSRPYNKINDDERRSYINNYLAGLKYPFEEDDDPSEKMLLLDLKEASLKMIERMKRFRIKSETNIILDVFDKNIQIYPFFSNKVDEIKDNILKCKLDERLLRRILNRGAHWNNAEIGAHINYIRSPNVYEPDIHTGLQFLHL